MGIKAVGLRKGNGQGVGVGGESSFKANQRPCSASAWKSNSPTPLKVPRKFTHEKQERELKSKLSHKKWMLLQQFLKLWYKKYFDTLSIFMYI